MNIKTIFCAVLVLTGSQSFAGQVVDVKSTGTKHCGSSVTRINATTLPLYFDVTSETSVDVWDHNYNYITTLDVISGSISSTKTAFNAVGTDGTDYMALDGTVIFGSTGQIKTMKGTFIVRDGSGSCFSAGKFTGKFVGII